MASANTSNRTLDIDGMTGELCVQKVTGALKSIPGVLTLSVKVGQATIEADEAACGLACKAIQNAGYPTRESSSSDNAQGSSRGNQSDTQAQRPNKERTYANAGGGNKGGAQQFGNAPATPAGARK